MCVCEREAKRDYCPETIAELIRLGLLRCKFTLRCQKLILPEAQVVPKSFKSLVRITATKNNSKTVPDVI